MTTRRFDPPGGGGDSRTTSRPARARSPARGWLVLAILASLTTAAAAQSANPIPPEETTPATEPDTPEGAVRSLEFPSSSDPAGNLGIRSVPSNGVDPATGLPADPGLPAAVAPFAPADTLTEPMPGLDLDLDGLARPRLVLTARLTDGGKPIRSGLVWRVFGATPNAEGALPVVAQGAGGNATFDVPPGIYLVYCGFGHAGTTVRVEIKGGLVEEAVVLNAGGLKLRAAAEGDRILPPDDVRFDVLSLDMDDRGERKIVARDVKPDELVRLAADTYQVVSRYGAVNAHTRGDVEVKAGKLTEVTLYQRAAEVTLKLVGAPGGEAIADTSWSILTPGGDIVTEGVGAFPSFVLAEGDYTVVARHGEKVFQRQFQVETGQDEEVEVVAGE
jgi:hypothetical protein